MASRSTQTLSVALALTGGWTGSCCIGISTKRHAAFGQAAQLADSRVLEIQKALVSRERRKEIGMSASQKWASIQQNAD